jgi:hypothetical protein
MARGDFDDRRVGVALRGAQQVCAAGAADAALLDALEGMARWLEGVGTHRWKVPEMRLLTRQVLVAAMPPDLLDLSLVRDGDAWAAPARAAADAAPPEEVGPLVRLLGDLGSRSPSKTWRASVAAALDEPEARTLLRRWLELAAQAPAVAPDETAAVGFSGAMLFCHGNDELVRAAVLATGAVDEPWVPGVLGVLARRGAATSGVPGMTASLCLKVAGAAVDTLAARGTPADRSVLDELLEDLSRRDLVRRVGAALGREEQAARRDEELRRTKAAAVRAKADPAPRQARAAVDARLRAHLAPILRELGFRGSGRTFRRAHDDRVDVVTFSSGDAGLSVAYGTRFDAAHPSDEPWPVPRDKVLGHDLDFRLFEELESSDEALARFAGRLRDVVVPFLDSLGRYELVLALGEHGAGRPHGAVPLEGVRSPATSGVLGLLALSAGDLPTAVEHLGRRLRFEESRDHDEADRDSLAFWRRRLEQARGH